MELREKILEAFKGKVVRKDLAFLVKGGLPVPTYVLEYLLGQYCANDDEAAIEEGLEKVKLVIQKNYVHRAEAESVKGVIRESGKHRVIDKVTVVLNEKEDEYHATFANLGLTGVPISTQYVRANPKLLSGNGVWCIVTIGYVSGEAVKVRWEIQTFKPIQISNINISDFIEQRSKFTSDEWTDLLIHTMGLNPETLNRREKLITLARLLPHVENNFNFVELGPKGTGKSHIFQELSPFGVLISGGDVTSARLFVRLSGKREEIGLVGYWDVVAWDEFEQQKGRAVDAVLIDTMQNYLANKSFNRGKGTHEASASMCFVGNTKHTVPYMLKNTHLFESIPTSFIKGAFLDRIHLYNPGWEIKTLKKSSFSVGYGLISDYLAAVLHELRNIDLTSMLKNYAKFDASLSERDHLAIRKTFSGFIKLLYPDMRMTDEEAKEILDFAAEARKRVKDQLYIIDPTFRAEPAKFEYVWVKTGETVKVETLEGIECELKRPAESESESTVKDNHEPRPRIKPLVAKTVMVRENQSGVTYRDLFGDYLRTAKEITLVDPFIRQPYQIDNLVDFIQMIRDVTSVTDGLKIHLSTQNDDDAKTAEVIDSFTDIADELQTLGIEFSFDFKADHDRFIDTDTRWHITLGRGLDIYEKFPRFSLCRGSQGDRRCKAFNVSINRSDT